MFFFLTLPVRYPLRATLTCRPVALVGVFVASSHLMSTFFKLFNEWSVGPLSSPPSVRRPSRMTLTCRLVVLMVTFVVFPPPRSCLAATIFKLFKLFEYFLVLSAQVGESVLRLPPFFV